MNMKNAESNVLKFQRTLSLSNIKGIKVLGTVINKTNKIENLENVCRNKIFIPCDTVTLDQTREVDQILVSFNNSCSCLENLIIKLNISFKYDIYRGIEITSNKIINLTDELFYIYRKLRKKFLQIGFVRLRAMNNAQKIPYTITRIRNILEHFLHLRNMCYFSEISVFNENIEEGCKILDKYIEKFNYLIEGCERWVEKFFEY